MLKKKIYIYIYIFYSHKNLSDFNSFLSLPSLLYFSISSLSSLRTQTTSLLSLPSLVVVFGCDRSLKGVVGRGWVHCGLWVVGRRGCGSVVVVDRRGCGLWIGVVGWYWRGWVVDWRGWVVVVDRRLKGVVGRGSASWDEAGRWSWIGG